LRESIGGRWCDVDLQPVRDKAALLAALARACGFPPVFGGNWDALADALQDVSWLGSGPFVLNLRHTGPAAGALGEAWSTLLEVLQFSLIYWKDRGELFVVFVDEAAGLPSWQ
jgi:hypothetical protein